MKKIFCFINGGNGVDWNEVIALCEDGHHLARHISFSKSFAIHDIGINSDCKHDNYKAHCPDGYKLVWIDDPANDEELASAYQKNQALGKAAEEANK